MDNSLVPYMLPLLGNTELVDDENGICVPPDDVEALASALTLLIDNEDMRKKMGTASLAKIKRSYSWRRSMSELEAYYKSLVVH